MEQENDMVKVVLAGSYPANTYEAVRRALPADRFEISRVETEEAYQTMTDAEIVILRVFKAPRDVIERNRNLKMIMRWGAGYDSVDIGAAAEHGVLVTNTPGANAAAVSELSVLLMLAVGRKLLCHTESLGRGQWSKNTFIDGSISLNHKLVGIVGGGNIGRQVAKRVQSFGAEVQYYDTFRLAPEMEEEYRMKYVSFDTLLETSDVVTLHIPLTDSNRHMIGREEIARMKDGAILINAARGGLVDDRALAAAVASGKLRGAGLDCVEQEPLPQGHELLENPNIVITPHVGGGTADIGDTIIPMLVRDIVDFADGKEPVHVVNAVPYGR